VVVPLLRDSGPFTPVGSVGRKSHGTLDSVESRVVGGPSNSDTVTRPPPPASGGTVNLYTQAPFHENAGLSLKNAVWIAGSAHVPAVWRLSGSWEQRPGRGPCAACQLMVVVAGALVPPALVAVTV